MKRLTGRLMFTGFLVNVCIVALVILANLREASGGTAVNTLDDYYSGAGHVYTFSGKKAQSFYAKSNKLGAVRFFVGDTGSNNNVTVSIQADSGDKPSGTNLASTTSQFTAWSSNKIPISVSGLTIGSKYWIVLNGLSNTKFYFDHKDFLDSAAVGSWHLNENFSNKAYDDSNWGNTGTIFNATWTVGKIGSYALKFDGGGYVNCGTGSSLAPTAKITVSAWIKPTSKAGYPTIVHKGNGWDDGYSLRIDADLGRIDWQIRTNTAPYYYRIYGGTAIPLNRWSHVVGVYDGSYIKTYLNGVLMDSKRASGSMIVNSAKALQIGYRAQEVYSADFSGKIDEVKIYSTGLSLADIQKQYANQTIVKGYTSYTDGTPLERHAAKYWDGYNWQYEVTGANWIAYKFETYADKGGELYPTIHEKSVNYMTKDHNYATSTAILMRDFAKFKRDGITVINIAMYWYHLEGNTQGDYANADIFLTNVKRVIGLANYYGLKVQLTFQTLWGDDSIWCTPDYVTDPVSATNIGLAIVRSEAMRQAFINMFSHTVNNLNLAGTPNIWAWAILNEPWLGGQAMDRENFITLFEDLAEIVKAKDNNRQCTIRFVNEKPWDSNCTGLYNKFRDDWNEDLRIYSILDFVSFNSYLPDESTNIYNTWVDILKTNVLSTRGYNRTVWLSEFGTASLDNNYQEAEFGRALNVCHSFPIQGVASWAWDSENALKDGIGDYNICAYLDGSARPAYNRMIQVGNWGFNDNTYDTSGNSNHGTLCGTSWVPGVIGKALRFGGVSDYVNFGSGASLNTGKIWTRELWLTRLADSGGEEMLFTTGNEYNFGYRLFITAGDKLQIHFQENGGGWRQGYVTGTTSILPNVPYHVVVTYDSKNLKIYVNGRLENTSPDYSGYLDAAFVKFEIGRARNSSAAVYRYGFNGIIDELKTYNVALSPTEIWDRRMVKVGNWGFNEGQGNTTYDTSGNNNNGTLYGPAYWFTGSGITGKAIQFDGAGAYVGCGSGSGLNMGKVWTRELVFKRFADSGGEEMLFTTGDQYSFGYRLFITAGDKLQIHFQENGGAWRQGYLTGTTTILVNVTYHVVVTYDGVNLRMYVNDNFEGISADYSGYLDAAFVRFEIGRARSSSAAVYQYGFRGIIDEVKTYNMPSDQHQ